jgi:hypothetical protein
MRVVNTFVVLGLLTLFASPAHAAVLCLRPSGTLKVRDAACTSRETAISDLGGLGVQAQDVGALAYDVSSTPAVQSETETFLTFDSEEWDTANLHDPTVNPGRLTVPSAGKYLVVANVGFEANASGARNLYINVNGTAYTASQVYVNASTHPSSETLLVATAIVSLNAGDYVTIGIGQNSGAPLSLYRSAGPLANFSLYPYVSVQKLN